MPEIVAKSRKLASAVYLITGFFGDQEPMKWKLRALAVDLVSESTKDKNSTAREILALFGMAKNIGLVSDSNYEILSREFSKLIEWFENPLKSMFIGEPSIPKETLPEPVRPESIKDKYLEHSARHNETDSQTRPFKDYGRVSVKKNSRQSIIITILKRKKEIMIKDVSPLIEGVSEKTIQRELLAMVASGILKKIGEKRWSRYSLA